MVAVLVSAAVIMPRPEGTAVARAHFVSVSLESVPFVDRASHRVAQVGRSFGAAQASGTVNVAPVSADAETKRRFKAVGYDLDAVLKGQDDVPRVILASLPGDLSHIRETDVRKAMFFKTMLPLVLQVNEQILEDRQRLREISAATRAGQSLEAVDRLWLAVMAERYGTNRGDVEALLKRHDVVPPSLALAQAATESAWGTSRFVKEGNAIFGQYTSANDLDSLVPSARQDGKTHRIKAFDSLYDSVASYITNLNNHDAYQEFRAMRAEMRARGQALDGKRLATALHRYSERGMDYVSDLHVIMDGNSLSMLDHARLSRSGYRVPVI